MLSGISTEASSNTKNNTFLLHDQHMVIEWQMTGGQSDCQLPGYSPSPLTFAFLSCFWMLDYWASKASLGCNCRWMPFSNTCQEHSSSVVLNHLVTHYPWILSFTCGLFSSECFKYIWICLDTFMGIVNHNWISGLGCPPAKMHSN